MTIATTIQADSPIQSGPSSANFQGSADEFEIWARTQELATYEWVNGKISMMAPVSDWHNDINRWLVMLLGQYIESRDLGLLRYNMFVRTPKQRRVPDLFYLKRENVARLQSNALEGPADLVVEIVSADSGSRDWRDKYLEYEAAGVAEYWVIDPQSNVIECSSLVADHFQQIASTDGKIHSAVLPGFYLRSEWLWQRPLPKVANILRELGVSL